MRVLKKTIWPYQVKLDPKKDFDGSYYFDPRSEWLEERMDKDRFYVIGPNTFCFKTQEDAVMFTLRWS